MASKKASLPLEKFTEAGFSTYPDYAHVEILDVFVGEMDVPPGYDPIPRVLIGHATDKRKRGLNPRAARVMAEALLKAADRAEALEVEMGCHPDAEKFDEIVKKRHDS